MRPGLKFTPVKIISFCYLPLNPRLQRLYMSTHTASDMRWHKDRRVDDNVLRHLTDGETWKEFDRLYPNFAREQGTLDWNLRQTSLICSEF